MRPIHLLASLLAFAVPATAQSMPKELTAPPGFLRPSSSGDVCSHWGVYHEGRTQYGYAGFSVIPAVLKQVSLRTQTTRTYNADNGAARSWQRVKLSVGTTDLAKPLSKTFSKNYHGTPTKVFDGALTLPGQSGKPGHIWGNVAALSFTTTFMFPGRILDLLHEWDWSGGKLKNGGDWKLYKNYLTDGTSDGRQMQIVASPYLKDPKGSKWLPRNPFQAPFCNDSAVTATNRNAFGELRIRIYAEGHPQRRKRGSAQNDGTYSQYTAPNEATVIGVMTHRGFDNGIPVGARCNKQYVDMTAVVAAASVKTRKSSSIATFFPAHVRNYDLAYVNRELYFQCAWADSRTGQLSLSIASKLRLPPKPKGFTRWMLYEAWLVEGKKRTKFGPTTSGSTTSFPILKFRTK